MLELLELGKSPPAAWSRAMPSPKAGRGAPSLTQRFLQATYLTQVALPHTKQITTEKILHA